MFREVPESSVTDHTHFLGIFTLSRDCGNCNRSFVGASRFSTDDAVRCPYFATAAAATAARYKGRREGGREGLAASPVPPTMRGFWFGRDTEADTLHSGSVRLF